MKKLKRRTLLIVAIGLIAVIVVSSLVIYGNSVLNPAGSRVLWQRNIENFATGLAVDNGKVFTMDISGNVNCYDIQTGASIWNGSSVGGYFASGLTIGEGKIYGGYRYTSVGCLDEATGQFQWNVMPNIDHNQAPDNIIVQDGRLFIVAEGPSAGVSARNASTGQLLWQARNSYTDFGNISAEAWWVSGYPLGGNPFEGSMLYALGGNASSHYIFKLNTDNGSIIWQAGLVRFNGIPNVLVTTQNQVIIENGDQILCLDETLGHQLWRFDVDKSIYQPTIYQGMVFFGASDGYFYALNTSAVGLEWITHVDSQSLMPKVNNDNITLTTYPVQVDSENNRLYWSFGVTQQLGTNSGDKHDTYTGTVCSLDLATGNVVWTKQMEDSGVFYSPPVGMVVNKDTLYLTENTALWVFSASTGNLARNQHFDHYVLPPVILNHEVFVASDLQLTAYE